MSHTHTAPFTEGLRRGKGTTPTKTLDTQGTSLSQPQDGRGLQDASVLPRFTDGNVESPEECYQWVGLGFEASPSSLSSFVTWEGILRSLSPEGLCKEASLFLRSSSDNDVGSQGSSVFRALLSAQRAQGRSQTNLAVVLNDPCSPMPSFCLVPKPSQVQVHLL